MKYLQESSLIKILNTYFSKIIEVSGKFTESCLLLNGINVLKNEPIRWNVEDGTKPVMSSVTRQIHLLRAFKLLSNVTGDNTFSDRYKEILNFYFSKYQTSSGLLNWGAHVFIDLETMKTAGPINKEMQHELKDTFPDYDSLYDVNPDATLRFIKSFWGSHVAEKETLVISRHGSLTDDLGFDFSKFESSEVNSLFSNFLTFLNSADDLIYSALKYYKYTKNINAVKVSESLYNKYVSSRDKKTGLGVYLYTIPNKREKTNDDNNTMSWFGDRAQRQFGEEFGDIALEKNMLLENLVNTLYAENPVMLFNMYREIGDIVKPMCLQAVDGLMAFSKYIYIKEFNKCRPMFVDGTDLCNYALKRDGYYGKKGFRFSRYNPNGKTFAANLLGAVLFDNRTLFETARSMFKGFGLGLLGETISSKPMPDYSTRCANPHIAIALTDMYLLTDFKEYLYLAECVIDRIIRYNWYEPFFKPSIANINALFDSCEAYAVAYLLAAYKGIKAEPFFSSNGAIYGNFLYDNGVVGDAFDKRVFNGVG